MVFPNTLATAVFCELRFRSCGFCSESGRDDRLQERHHGAEAGASCSMAFCCSALRLARKFGQPLFVLLDPLFGEAAIANFGEQFSSFHRGFAE